MKNPFTVGPILPGEPFCNRKPELEELRKRVVNSDHVVMFSPRRYGKTSLVRQMMKTLDEENVVTAYHDFFPVTDRESFVQKLAVMVTKATGKGLTHPTHPSFLDNLKALFKRLVPTIETTPEGINLSVHYDEKIGVSYLIEDIFQGLSRYLSREKRKCLLVFDEFQEITKLDESAAIEGSLRGQIQTSREISCFFIGSRRRILQDMFTDSKRPFYKSSFPFRLDAIPRDELVNFIIDRCASTGKKCPRKIAEEVYDYVEGYTGYVQRLAHVIWDMAEKNISAGTLKNAKQSFMAMESLDFQGIFAGLTRTEQKLVLALAVDPTDKPFSAKFLSKHGLTQGGTQRAFKSLIDRDIVDSELAAKGSFRLTDPVFAKWGAANSIGTLI
ncbi:MAG: Archaeal ATPase [Syntrophorhabdaceae bacterium PtaU1.Bin034]|nr:MAG: Archaeal ATPase [Syntrophorhabdaceae bacterium PtaU1.Bin034]